jgi:L-threonylcarbamoyladenylate synthase
MLGGKAEIILDGGPSQVGLESTVLDICHGQPRILRPGGTPQEAIEALIGPVAFGPAGGGISSPGMLKSHYAPRVPLAVRDSEAMRGEPWNEGTAYLFFDGASRDAWLSTQPKPDTPVFTLSAAGNTREAASRLFELLHELDRLNVKLICAQLAPEEGLGAAINDRLRRAAAQ